MLNVVFELGFVHTRGFLDYLFAFLFGQIVDVLNGAEISAQFFLEAFGQIIQITKQINHLKPIIGLRRFFYSLILHHKSCPIKLTQLFSAKLGKIVIGNIRFIL